MATQNWIRINAKVEHPELKTVEYKEVEQRSSLPLLQFSRHQRQDQIQQQLFFEPSALPFLSFLHLPFHFHQINMHSVAALTALLSLSALGINALPAAQAQNQALVQCNPAREDCTGKQVFCNPAREDCSGKNKPIADNKWTISKVYIGCGNDPAKGGAFCSYEFDVEGKETADLPGFSAHCYQREPHFHCIGRIYLLMLDRQYPTRWYY